MKKIITLALVFLLLIAPISSADEAVQSSGEENPVLLQLKQKLAEAKYRYYNLKNNVESAHTNIDEIEKQIMTLQGALDNLDNLIKDTNSKITSVKTQIERQKMDIRDLEEDMGINELQIEDQKQVVGDLMALLYVKRGIYYDDNQVNAVKVLASDGTISETLQKVTYLDLMEKENSSQIVKLAEMQNEYQEKWNKLREKKDQLAKLDAELEGEMNNLEAEREGQKNLLDETKGDEAIYQAMIMSAGDKEVDILKEIEVYQENIDEMERKLAGERPNLSEDDKSLISQIEIETKEEFKPEEAAEAVNFDWPVSPERGITALFHDSGYQTLFGVDHYAIDIRANQSSPIYAPADGIVFNVVFDATSTKYAYIMVAHRKGVMTLYGHISEPNVKVGDFVKRGDVIGLTGATPHTIGAGVRTTGPHLHFEVWQDGARIDPLKYLPLDQVPMDSLPEQYLNQLKTKLEDQIKQIQSQLN